MRSSIICDHEFADAYPSMWKRHYEHVDLQKGLPGAFQLTIMTCSRAPRVTATKLAIFCSLDGARGSHTMTLARSGLGVSLRCLRTGKQGKRRNWPSAAPHVSGLGNVNAVR
jgi:hypothetical protein